MAIVMMPSFVPNVTFDVRANWFSLTNPRKKLLTLQDTMALSRNYQAVRSTGDRVRHSHHYRPGDVSQLLRVVDQLERRLPLQSMLVQIPFENTLGGFEMFQTGVTDLGPELTGWYGAPGVHVVSPLPSQADANPAPASAPQASRELDKRNWPMSTTSLLVADQAPAESGQKDSSQSDTNDGKPKSPSAPPSATCPGISMQGPNQCVGTCDGTTLFLVGRQFSVHDTQVIAGGHCVPFVLLSREYMRVTIPRDVLTVASKEQGALEFVDVHIATPYGVSGSLLIPALRSDKFVVSEPACKAESAATSQSEQPKADEEEEPTLAPPREPKTPKKQNDARQTSSHRYGLSRADKRQKSGHTAVRSSSPRSKTPAAPQLGPALPDSHSGRAAAEELSPPRRLRAVDVEPQEGGWRPARRSAASLAGKDAKRPQARPAPPGDSLVVTSE